MAQETNEQKAKEIAGYRHDETPEIPMFQGQDGDKYACFDSAMAMADFKDSQPISELGGWHTEPPTEDGCYLAETFRIPYKNCLYIVAEYDTNAQAWYDEAYENEIEIKRWKKI